MPPSASPGLYSTVLFPQELVWFAVAILDGRIDRIRAGIGWAPVV